MAVFNDESLTARKYWSGQKPIFILKLIVTERLLRKCNHAQGAA